MNTDLLAEQALIALSALLRETERIDLDAIDAAWYDIPVDSNQPNEGDENE